METLVYKWCTTEEGEKTAPEKEKGKAEERKVLQNQGRNFKERTVHRDIKKKFL